MSSTEVKVHSKTYQGRIQDFFTGGRVVRYDFGNLFDFDYLFKYLRKLIRNIFTY